MDYINVFFTINDYYAKYLAVTIASIISNTNEKIKIFILDGNISDKNKQKIEQLKRIKNFEIQYLKIDKNKFSQIPESCQAHISKETNYRFLISSLVPELSKCIFIDADLIFVDDIKKLWEIDITDYYMAAVPDQAPLGPDYSGTNNLPLKESYRYVNTGVSLINLLKWRENNIEEKLFENVIKYSKILQYPDQDTLNITLQEKVKVLPHQYNAMPVQKYYNRLEETEAFTNPIVIHWAGFQKPWVDNKVRYFKEYKKYAKRTPFFMEIFNDLYKKLLKKTLQQIFSVKFLISNSKKYKVISILGIKVQLQKKTKFEKLLKKKFDPNLSLEDKKYIIENQFEQAVGYKPNIDKPKTFNEKLQWLKLYNEDSLLTKCADKYLVREYVKEKIGSEYLIPLLGVWDSPDDINFDKLPNQFVLKVNWGSGQNIIAKDKTNFDIKEAKKKLQNWIKPKSNHYYYSFEWCYKNIEPKIIAEPFIQQLNEDLYDYKLLCYNGKVKNLFVVSDRFNNKFVDFYDINWNKLPFERLYHNSPNGIPKPENLEPMICLAEKLAKDFPFARVDFYNIEGQLYFGEITFYPGNGMEPFTPIEWDYKLGEMLNLSELMK